MGPKKKQPKNAFYFYVMDYREDLAAQGITFPNLREAFDYAGPRWQALSREEKNRYEAIAREHKLNEQQTIKKYTTTGKSFDEVDREMQERRAEESRMETEIRNTVAVLDYKGLQTKIFYFMHVNYYCRVEEKQFIPCELAISQFNFVCGAFNFYHTLVNPGEIPLGYAFELQKRSEETHQIPFPPPSTAENNYSKILLNIVRFMKDDAEDGKLPPVYTYGTDGTFEAVKDVLDALCDHEAMQEYSRVSPLPESFRVYPLPKLFFELRNKASSLANKTNQAFPVESLATRELEKNLYSFTPGICCEMHEGTDAGQYCSLSIVRRWSFIIADHCCKDLGIELAPGQHIPPPINQQKSRHAQDMIMRGKNEKLPDPVVPSTVDYSRAKSRLSSSVQVVAGKEEKKTVDPIMPVLIDYSQKKQSPEPLAEKAETIPVGRARSITANYSGAVRRPKTVGLALQNCPPAPPYSDHDFPAIGGAGSSGSSGLILGQPPLKVAGRGSAIGNLGSLPTRGRGLSGSLNK